MRINKWDNRKNKAVQMDKNDDLITKFSLIKSSKFKVMNIKNS